MIWLLAGPALIIGAFIFLWLWGACEALGAVITDAMNEALNRWDR
jgi:hypothetical protein